MGRLLAASSFQLNCNIGNRFFFIISLIILFDYTLLHVEHNIDSTKQCYKDSMVNFQFANRSLWDNNVYVTINDVVSYFILHFLSPSPRSSSLLISKRPRRTWRWPSWRHARASVTLDVRWATVCLCSVRLSSLTSRLQKQRDMSWLSHTCCFASVAMSPCRLLSSFFHLFQNPISFKLH